MKNMHKMGFHESVVSQVFDGKISTWRLRNHKLQKGDVVAFENSQTQETFGYGKITNVTNTTVGEIDLKDKTHYTTYKNRGKLIRAFKRHYPAYNITNDTLVFAYTYTFTKKVVDVQKLYITIVADLKKYESREGAEYAKRWHKYDYHSYGMRWPEMRSVHKKYKKEIQALTCKEAFVLAKKLYAPHIEEQTLTGNYVLQQNIGCITPEKFSIVDTALNNCKSWSAVDDLCVEGGKIMHPLLLRYPKKVLALLRKWNTSKNRWKRRASVVPFTRKIGESGTFTKQGLELCNNLIWDKEDLVQKAVGWALKDMMRGDKHNVFAYVKKIRKAGVSSTITLYAIRDLPQAERQQILRIT